VHAFATLECPPTLYYGEKMSVADHEERLQRRDGMAGELTIRGNFVDYIYKVTDTEFGVGESSGYVKGSHIHSSEDSLALARVARAQLLCLKERAPDATDLAVAYFHVYGSRCDFFVMYSFSPDLFVRCKLCPTVSFARDDGQARSILAMCRAFLCMRGIMTRTKEAVDRLQRASIGPVMSSTPALSLDPYWVSPKKATKGTKAPKQS